MRTYLWISILALSCSLGCRPRGNPTTDSTDENSDLIIADPGILGTTTVQVPSSENSNPKPVTETKAEEKSPAETPPVIVKPSGEAPRIEALAFAHAKGLCLQVDKTGTTSLQACSEQAVGQKFLFARSLDGRLQLKDTSSQLCLQMGSIGFFTTLLGAATCESKAEQFFSVVDYGDNYSLKFDGNNTCIDAEDSAVAAGTRLLFYRCSAALNQRIMFLKK